MIRVRSDSVGAGTTAEIARSFKQGGTPLGREITERRIANRLDEKKEIRT